MSTINCETILIEGRQPSLRWSAVFAGTVSSIGFWMLLQLLGVGVGLAAVNPNNAESLRNASVGATVWSLATPLIAMFCGGLLAGKLAQTFDRKIAGMHGLVTWAMTAILGLTATIWTVTAVAAGAARAGAAINATGQMMPSTSNEAPLTLRALGIDAADVLASFNQQLSAQGKPRITVAQLDAAVRGMVSTGLAQGNFDQELLVNQIVANTTLSRADAGDLERQIEARVDGIDATNAHPLEHRTARYVLEAADATGKALLTVGSSLLLSLISSVLGAVIAVRRSRKSGESEVFRDVHITEPGFPPPNEP
jgi:hypothetical protein